MKNDSTNVLRLAAEDLACYAIALWPGFELAAHHRIIVEKLEAIERGEIRRLIICMPPQHGKSLLATQLFPAWYLGRHPDRAVITASYGQELADDFGRRVRGFVSDPVHRAIFPGSRLSESSASVRRFNTTQGGTYYAVGRGGPITGRGAALLVIDDPIKDREEAQSETVRRSLFEWYQTVAYTRLRPTAPIVLIQTRWHADDLAGRLLRDCSDNWEILSLPAIAETDETFRHAGEALWPQKFSLEDLKRIRAVIGGPAFVSLYQQNPSAAEGAIFRRAWWQFFREPPVFLRVLQSWDTGFKTGTENDYSVCTTWGVAENGYYLLWLWRDRVEFPERKKRIAWMAEQYKPAQI